MKIQYEITAADMAGVVTRAFSRAQSSITWGWQRRVFVPAILSAGFYSVLGGPEILRLIDAIVFFAVIYVALWYTRIRARSSHFVAYFRQQLGGDGPFPFAMEITPDGLVTRQLGEDVSRGWPAVTKITEADAGIIFAMRLGTFILVPNSAFKSTEEKAEFLRLARRYASAHDGSQG